MKGLSRQINKYLLIAIVIFSFSLRIVGVNWDQNQHMHPDERFLTMVVGALKWPNGISDYLNSSVSTLNPNNAGFGFYVYGTLPTTLNKLISQLIIIDPYPYNNIALTGRLLSVIFDIGTLILVYKISKHIFDEKIALLSSFIYGILVLPIQLSHFFTVDPPLTFFLTLSFYFLLKTINSKNTFYAILTGISFGAAFASKISAVLLLPIILIGFLVHLIKQKRVILTAYCILLTAVFTCLSYRIFDPHAFSGSILFPSINKVFLANLETLRFWSRKDSMYPPAIQWLSINPIIFPIKNIILWGVGLPQSILLFFGIIFLFVKTLKEFTFPMSKLLKFKWLFQKLQRVDIKNYHFLLIIIWVLVAYVYETAQLAPSMRYFYPIYPMFAIIIAHFSINYLFSKFKNSYLLYSIYYVLIFIWPLSFIQIYKRHHSRITASRWIYENIPAGSTLSCEYWDDCLPLSLGSNYYPQLYKIETLDLYTPETAEKWEKLNAQLENVDYLIMSSNRLWGSIPKVPEVYPATSEFYNELFAEKLQFTKVVEITSYPTLKIGDWKLEIKDDSSEEAFTVYDHPKVLIFKRV